MASSSYGDDLVVLNCIGPHKMELEANRKETVISTAEISSWDLPGILSHQIVNVKANRNRLIEQSSYFGGLLGGSFSESCLDCISIHWNLETLMIVLKFMFGHQVDVTSNNFLPLYEGALYFGVETLLSKCKVWLSDVTSSKELCSPQVKLDDLIHIWNFSLEHANDFIPELCTSYLARKFQMWAMFSNSFGDVPYNLLLSCIKHPQLIVDSEKHLSEALLVWLACNTKQIESLNSTNGGCTNILKEIRISLLPLWYAAGKKRCCFFSKFANESINAILSLMGHPSTSSLDVFGDGDLSCMRIRLTSDTKKVDLSGCPQIKPAVLLLSMLPCSYSMDPKLRKNIKQSPTNLERLNGNQCQISWGLWPTLSFEAVQEVDISNCPMLHLEAAIECFCKSFPSLRILKATYFLSFKTAKLRQLMQRCPLLYDIDLTVDISPIIPTQVSIVSSFPSTTPNVSIVSSGIIGYPSDATLSYMSRPLLSNVTKLTLEGRIDVGDADLKNISESCVSLCYLNLKGCTSVTDAGISVLILRCLELHSIVVSDTSFGQNSILALCSTITNSAAQIEKKRSQTLAYKLQTLHMGGCNVFSAGANGTSLIKLMSQMCMLKSLCLRETELVDNALYSFCGSSLEMLDVSDTKVSGAALAHIVHRNPGLKIWKASGCQNLFQQGSKNEGEDFPSSPYSCMELSFELGKTCKLEEIVLGWGFSCLSMEALRPAITTLRAITVGLGASLGQDALELLPKTCPLLESVILYFQVISDCIVINIMENLRYLQVLALCYCLGEMSSLSFKCNMPNLRKLRLQRVTPWMTNDDLSILTQNCGKLIELSLLGCRLLNSDSQQIISNGWPGLISIHLEECGELTTNGVMSLFDCKALEDLLLRHNGPGIQKNFIVAAASKLPMLRKVSLDLCDASDGDFDIPDFADRYFMSTVKIARCKLQRCTLDLQKLKARKTPVHKETLVLVWDSKNLTRTVVKERL
ncbi:BTB/POZ domain-containing protein FBL11 isoform X2 [Cornus florida]|uniref:BTB/POZ domain-containing protein FBL11 isoform X2 n=1 Tax=Cornus florida TaxID=4283 RepID=UPI002899A6EF|nr:BTB/POZ domain-containing protein FBL11 isoform X2 [Cornus florida]